MSFGLLMLVYHCSTSVSISSRMVCSIVVLSGMFRDILALNFFCFAWEKHGLGCMGVCIAAVDIVRWVHDRWS